MGLDDGTWGVCKRFSSSVLLASCSNAYRRLVAETRRLREMLKGLLNAALLIMRCIQLNRNFRCVDSVDCVLPTT